MHSSLQLDLEYLRLSHSSTVPSWTPALVAWALPDACFQLGWKGPVKPTALRDQVDCPCLLAWSLPVTLTDERATFALQLSEHFPFRACKNSRPASETSTDLHDEDHSLLDRNKKRSMALRVTDVMLNVQRIVNLVASCSTHQDLDQTFNEPSGYYAGLCNCCPARAASFQG